MLYTSVEVYSGLLPVIQKGFLYVVRYVSTGYIGHHQTLLLHKLKFSQNTPILHEETQIIADIQKENRCLSAALCLRRT